MNGSPFFQVHLNQNEFWVLHLFFVLRVVVAASTTTVVVVNVAVVADVVVVVADDVLYLVGLFSQRCH